MDSLGWVPTRSGRRLNVLAPAAADIVIEDIASGLSQENRWNGQLEMPISVAQHSVGVSYLLPPELALWGLLHDASEAYLKDVPRGLKALPAFAGYRAIEALLQKVIYTKFGLIGDPPPELHEADALMAAAEARDLFPKLPPLGAWLEVHARADQAPKGPLVSWSPPRARDAFLTRFERLMHIKLHGAPAAVRSAS